MAIPTAELHVHLEGTADEEVLVALRRRDGGKVHVLNRTLEKAQALVTEIDGPFEAHGLDEFASLAPHIGLVVNTSSIGMQGSRFDWLDLSLLAQNRLFAAANSAAVPGSGNGSIA